MFSPGITALLQNAGPFVGNKFQQDPQKGFEICRNAKIFVVGAGGLGCEILKCLAFNGFKHIDIVDMDKIEVSNLNRQFLFRKKDVGRFKSEVAAEYVTNRVQGRFEGDIEINFHTCKIQEKDDAFYKEFDIVIGGLDNLEARFWMNETLVRIAKLYNKVIPYIDGGTTAWQGNIKVVFPNVTSCLECQRDSFPPEVTTFQACTLVSHPRKPEHCVFYAYQELWPSERPNDKFDADNEEHITWVTKEALKHAEKHNLKFEIDNRYTRKVVKNTVAAIASTQAIIASMCCTEAFKVLSDCAPLLNNKINQDMTGYFTNQIQFIGNSDYQGVNISHDYLIKKKDCKLCRGISTYKYNPDELVKDFVARVVKDGLVSDVQKFVRDEKSIILWMKRFKKQSEQNLNKKISEVGIVVGSQLQLESADGKPVKVVII